MTYLTHFSLGCVVITVLSLSGCAQNMGTLPKSDPGMQVVFGSNRPERSLSESDSGMAVVKGDRWW